MLTDDYLMRMINQVLAVFLQAMGLKKAGQFSEALQVFDQVVESLLGLRADLVKQLEDRQLLALLTFQDKLDVIRLLLLADIFCEEGEVYARLEQPTQNRLTTQLALRLYLEAALAAEGSPTLDVVQKIEMLRARISTPGLPVDTRLALLDYFDRLLTSENDFLTTTGLSRLDLQAALAALDIGDLH